jgi:hypothetical protein
MVFWRKNPATKKSELNPDPNGVREASNKAGSEPHHSIRDSEDREKDWLCVGNDEEGTQIYLDRNRMVRPSGSTPAQVWLKHIPIQGALSFEQARKYLKETGADWKAFCYIEQLLELDLNRNLIADLALFFFDRNDHLIEQVQFQESARRPLGEEAVYSAIREIVVGQNRQPDPRPEAALDQPSVDERIELKLQEINSAFEAFNTCDDLQNDSVKLRK